MDAGGGGPSATGRRTVMLSFDLEDWDQLMGRAAGRRGWDARGAGFTRQMKAVFGLLDELGVHATFFMLGVTMKHYPDVVREAVRRGDEIACHGYEHRRVYCQTPAQFRRDLHRCVALLDQIAGVRPTGYRAPLFSINGDTPWAYEILCDLGFRYDSSQNDTPRVPRRFRGIPDRPYRLGLPSGRSLWEVPVACARLRRLTLPIGGGSYWRALPAPLVQRALRRSRGPAALYFHPYELDPDALCTPVRRTATTRERARARMVAVGANVGRGRLGRTLRAVARHYKVSTYGEVLDDYEQNRDSRGRSLSAQSATLR